MNRIARRASSTTSALPTLSRRIASAGLRRPAAADARHSARSSQRPPSGIATAIDHERPHCWQRLPQLCKLCRNLGLIGMQPQILGSRIASLIASKRALTEAPLLCSTIREAPVTLL